MSTALVSAFYDINDVIHQSKQRPMMLDLRQKMEDRRPSNLLIPRRHSTNSTNINSLSSGLSKQQLMSPSAANFYSMPPSPKDQLLGNTSGNISPFRERCQSATFQDELDAQQRKRGATNSSRYKTELCRPFEENGTCKYGDKCQFAHGYHELRGLNRHPKYKTEFCRTYHTIGFCPYGPRCHFIHNDEEKKLAQANIGRSCSISSMDSVPPSPALEIAPSPFNNSLTPPTSPGFGGDVFLFDETSHQMQQNTLNLPMNAIPENFPSPNGNLMEFSQRRPVSVEVSLQSIEEFKPSSKTKFEERVYATPSDSGSSNPPSPSSPVDSLEELKRRLPVFGCLNS